MDEIEDVELDEKPLDKVAGGYGNNVNCDRSLTL